METARWDREYHLHSPVSPANHSLARSVCLIDIAVIVAIISIIVIIIVVMIVLVIVFVHDLCRHGKGMRNGVPMTANQKNKAGKQQ